MAHTLLAAGLARCVRQSALYEYLNCNMCEVRARKRGCRGLASRDKERWISTGSHLSGLYAVGVPTPWGCLKTQLSPQYPLPASQVQPCNTSGFIDPVWAAKWGIVDFDWSNTPRCATHPMGACIGAASSWHATRGH